jgi:hypothetical protein
VRGVSALHPAVDADARASTSKIVHVDRRHEDMPSTRLEDKRNQATVSALHPAPETDARAFTSGASTRRVSTSEEVVAPDIAPSQWLFTGLNYFYHIIIIIVIIIIIIIIIILIACPLG